MGNSLLNQVSVITSYSIHYTKLYEIPDYLDVCPTIGERYNNFEDEDGCPDLINAGLPGDSDFDGIPDSVDKCPDNPETYNKFQDEDGCPDKIVPGESNLDADGDGIIDRNNFV